jgi:hypothetical protein
MDYASLLYGPIYSVIGVPAVLTLCGGEPPLTLTAIDKTAGVEVSFNGADVVTIRPAAIVRATELANVPLASLRNASLEMNGKTWTVVEHGYVPAPTGEGNGEIRLFLEEA